MFIEKQDTKGGTYFIFPYLCTRIKESQLINFKYYE